MADKRYILLAVDDNRADELLKVLSKRSYIQHINFELIDQRRGFKFCPLCREELEKEWKVFVTEKMLEACLIILQGMKRTPTMVVYGYSMIEEVRPIDYERAVPISPKTLYAAKLLGLIGHYLDGTQDTYYVTEIGFNFLSNKKPLAPSELVVVKDKIMSSSGSIQIEEVKRKDPIKFNTLLKSLEDAVDNLPNEVVDFVRTGQISLL